MSKWLKSAVNRAMEARARNPLLSRTLRPLYSQPPIRERTIVGAQTWTSFDDAAKRLEELAVTCRGEERVELLRRWLLSLKGTPPVDSSEPTNLLFSDADLEGDMKNIREVFLHSHALEDIILSMVTFFYGSDSGSTKCRRIFLNVGDIWALFDRREGSP